jgi:hypothetical protein
VFAEEDRPVVIDPFNRALGLLGAGGWELVSVQHALRSPYDDDDWELHSLIGNILRDRVAYLKRHAVEGSAVDHPDPEM